MRNVATGQKAMAVAEQLALEGRRKNGRWQYGLFSNNETSTYSTDAAWLQAMKQAGSGSRSRLRSLPIKRSAGHAKLVV